ncbi:imelysin family protein [Pollutimonas thiosulfatoxidans]|uniref:imelysin family protein n=1 Tax=Pollutimonas thiosulfatoxidans TaxID=2028345 RepID=UPI001D185861|nr:imelysin family protein [Pollutimonas thiosulfatoxidans]
MTRSLQDIIRHSWCASIATLSLTLLTPASIAGTLPPTLGSNLVQGYIQPSMQHFQETAHQLNQRLQAWCPKPSAAGAETIHDAFAEVVRAWSRIEFLRFGPLVAATRFERIYFWPDPRGITLRQVQGLLAGAEPIPNAEALASHSVAVQGLPALEYVLYRQGGILAIGAQATPDQESSTLSADFDGACAYATSVSGNLASVGAELVQAWSEEGPYGKQFSNPTPDSPLYRSPQEVAAEAIKALSTGLQFAHDIKLMPVLGKGFKQAKATRAPFWRSGLSTEAMAASVEGMLQFYQAGGYIYSDDETWIDQNLRDELKRGVDNFKSLRQPMQQLTEGEDSYRRLTLAALLLENAKSIVDQRMAPAFGVRLGFNALDGD